MTDGHAAAGLTAHDLSCYTANLAEYLSGDYADPLGRIARSVRLAVRVDLPGGLVAFSHHDTPLNVLPDGHRLVYQGEPTADRMLERLTAEVTAYGRAIVVSHTTAMPWSRDTAGAPHFLLVDGRRGGDWHVTDAFSALLPSGRQDPFTGWLPESTLVRCMRPGPALPPVHRLRNRHAFGVPVPVPPDHTYQWLSRTRGDAGDEHAGTWIEETGPALDFLSERWASIAAEPGEALLLDDMWACAQHHVFRYAHLLARADLRDDARAAGAAAQKAWTDLPMTLRFAVDSARRSRPRPTLITTAFDHLRRAEAGCSAVTGLAPEPNVQEHRSGVRRKAGSQNS